MGHVTKDPEKFCIDLTHLVLRRVFEFFNENELDPFAKKALTESIHALLEQSMNIGETAFDSAFREGEDKGREEGREHALYDFKEQLRNFINDL